MPINNRQDYVIIDLIQQAVRNIKAQPLNLGAIAGSGGGVGGPPGGFIGQLPQTRVAYDTDEAATLDTVGSGTLIDNLNHIRYRIGQLEAGSGSLTVEEWDGDPSVVNVDTITFSGGVIVTELAPGHALVTITASGVAGSGIEEAPIDGTTYGRKDGTWVAISGVAGSGILVVDEYDGSPSVSNVNRISFSGALVTDLGGGHVLVTISGAAANCATYDELTPQIPASGNHFDLESTASGTMLLFYNGLFQPSGYYQLDGDNLGLTTDFPTYSGDSLVAIYNLCSSGGTIVTSGGSGTDENAFHDNVAGEINALTEKLVIASGDYVVIEDSEDSFSKKKFDMGNIVVASGGGGFTPNYFDLPIFAYDTQTNWNTISRSVAEDYYLLSANTINSEVGWNMNLPAGTYTWRIYYFRDGNRGNYHLFIDGTDKGNINGTGSQGVAIAELTGISIAGGSPVQVRIRMASTPGSDYYGTLFKSTLVRTGA